MNEKRLIDRANEYLDAGREFEAIVVFVVAAMSGDWDAWIRIIKIIEKSSISGENDIRRFFVNKYFHSVEEASAAGDVEAAFRLVGLCEFGQLGYPVDYSKAIELLLQLSESGEDRAQFELFEKHLYGLCGLEADKKRAMEWLRRSASNGNQEAIEWLRQFEQWDESGFQYPRKSQ